MVAIVGCGEPSQPSSVKSGQRSKPAQVVPVKNSGFASSDIKQSAKRGVSKSSGRFAMPSRKTSSNSVNATRAKSATTTATQTTRSTETSKPSLPSRWSSGKSNNVTTKSVSIKEKTATNTFLDEENEPAVRLWENETTAEQPETAVENTSEWSAGTDAVNADLGTASSFDDLSFNADDSISDESPWPSDSTKSDWRKQPSLKANQAVDVAGPEEQTSRVDGFGAAEESSAFEEFEIDEETTFNTVEDSASDKQDEIGDLLRIEPTKGEQSNVASVETQASSIPKIEASDFDAVRAFEAASSSFRAESIPNAPFESADVAKGYSINRAKDAGLAAEQKIADLNQKQPLAKSMHDRKPSAPARTWKALDAKPIDPQAEASDARKLEDKPLSSRPNWSQRNDVATKSEVNTNTKSNSKDVRVVRKSSKTQSSIAATRVKEQASPSTQSLSVGTVVPAKNFASSTRPVEHVFADRVRIRNASNIGLPVSFALGKQIKKLYPGEFFDVPLSPRAGVDIQFHGGGNLGVAAQRLSAGSYEFHVTANGWQLRRK